MRRRRAMALAAGVSLAMWLGAPPMLEVSAQQPAPDKPADKAEVYAEVVVLHGTNDGKGIAEDIKDLEEHLKQPPFSAYDTWKKLDSKTLPLVREVAGSMLLPDESKLTLILKDKKEDRFLVNASIQRKSGKKFLPGVDMSAVPGNYAFIAGQKFEGGILALGLRFVEKKK